MLILVFAVNLGWFPALGNGDGRSSTSVYHLTLPAIALAIASLALVARVTRASVREELGREHVQTAVSRGIPCRLVMRRHVLRNAAIPITTVAGLTIASLIAVDGGGREGVRPERPRRLPRRARRSPRTSPSCRASRWCWWRRSWSSTRSSTSSTRVLDPRVTLGSRAQ